MKIVKRFNKKPLTLALGALFGSALLVSTVQADDVDVYIVPPPSPPPTNILFVLDESGSMGSPFPGAPQPGDRNAGLKQAMTQILAAPSFSNVNAAIMGYTTPSGPWSQVQTPGLTVKSDFLPLNIPANVTTLTAAANSLAKLYSTPSVLALDTAVTWFSNGFTDGNGVVGTSPLNPTVYCSPNAIVFLTDGQPNSNNMTQYPIGGPNCGINNWSYSGGGTCAQEIVRSAFNTDLFPSDTGLQNIETSTVSMITQNSNPNADRFLQGLAREGHGFPFDCSGLTGAQLTACNGGPAGTNGSLYGYYQANNTAQLTAALTAIVQNANSSVSFSYNAPTIPVNPADAASSGDDIYIPMLVPNPNGASWKGNLKKYGLQRDPITGAINIVDANAAPALDSSKQILATAQSEWDVDSTPDGDEPQLGGVVEKMANDFQQISVINTSTGITDYDTMLTNGLIRKIVTYLATPSSGAVSEKKLFKPVNRIVPSNNPANCSNNPDILASMFGPAVTNTACLPMLQWLVTGSYDTGQVDAQGDPIIDYKFGAPIHTTPVVIGQGSTNSNKRIYLPTSDGMLHAFNKDGVELWAFMPQELMANLPQLINPTTTTPPIYGLDGNITVVHEDLNQNYQKDPGERVILVFGQRRGGNHYYAIDVTNPDEPEFAYQITGGTGQFAELGQTWSQPVYTTLDDGTTNGTKVLIFGGGYDTNQDLPAASTSRINDNIGNVIYIVDAFNGTFKKKINHANMKNGIPSRISIMDMDSDGLTDRLYAADVGGRIIRADINQTTGDWTSKVIADVGTAGGVKFFNQPTIAYEGGAGGFLSINVGSGNRADPDSQIDDSFFMIKDRNVWTAPTNPMVTTNDLVQITNSTGQISYSPTAAQKAQLKSKEGWQFTLDTGVKVFSTARVLDYATIFTTYTTTPSSTSVCSANAGQGSSRVYALNMLTGVGVFFDATSGNRENYQDLNMAFIPPSPVLIGDAGVPTTPTGPARPAMNDIFVGLEKAVSFPPRMYQLNWEEMIDSAP